MKIAFATPVGPDHEHRLGNCLESSEVAFRVDRGDFREFRHFTLDDTQGFWGRAAARNILLSRARGWGADWIINVDVTDVVHPRALHQISKAIRRSPDAQTVMGCISLWFDESGMDKYGLDQHHVYRPNADICPLSWDELIEKVNYGTVGTHSCVRMDLAWRLGFLPDLPAAEFFEFTHACFANAPYVKIPHPIVVIDRATYHAQKDDDPMVDHGYRLNGALRAISTVWRDRGRRPFSYDELEDRWRVRQYRTEELWDKRHVDDADAYDLILERSDPLHGMEGF